MLLLTKKLKTLLNIFKNIDITYNKSQDCYTIETKSNFMIKSDKNVFIVTKGDIVQIGKYIHINPDIPTTKKYKELS